MVLHWPRCWGYSTPIGRCCVDPELLAPWLRHEEPTRPLEVAEAHVITQRHINCQLEQCAMKGAAFALLVEVGRVVPSSRFDFRISD